MNCRGAVGVNVVGQRIQTWGIAGSALRAGRAFVVLPGSRAGLGQLC
jgi:hypothetical protein